MLLLALVAIIAALWGVRTLLRAPSSSAADVERPTLPAPTAPAPPSAAARSPAARATEPVADVPPANAAPAQVQQALTAGHVAMLDAARPCRRLDLRADARQQLRFRYTLDIHDHAARAQGVEKLDSDIENGEVVSCMLAAIATARWSYLGGDATLMAEERFSLADLDP